MAEDDDKNLIPSMTADEMRDYTPIDVRDDIHIVLDYVLRPTTGYPGQQHPPHVQAALRLQRWIGGDA